ncbi:hypothetical protein NL489_28220, partial [Klebsiella pneumoniae]|nr:hypothetical protein [Klebsiella pneumoniae]
FFKQIMMLFSFQLLPSPSDTLVTAGDKDLELDLLQQTGIGRLLYARHCGFPNDTFPSPLKSRTSEEHRLI